MTNPAKMDPGIQEVLSRFCYIFPALEMKDLKMAYDANSSPVDKMYFIQSASPPSPYNGFYAYENDKRRHMINSSVMHALEKTLAENEGVLKTGQVDNPRVIRAFLSIAHAGRTLNEMRACVDPESEAASFVGTKRAYERCIRLSFDTAATNVLDTIARHPDQVTIISINNEGDSTRMVPEPARKIVSEAFSGLAMIAVHEGNPYTAVSYATAALFRHADMLPYINCVRLMSVVRRMPEATMRLTDTVLLPFFLMSKDPHIYFLHVKELRQWDPRQRSKMLTHARTVSMQAVSFHRRFSGSFGIVSAKLERGVFVECLCAVCGIGKMGEKMFRCAKCSRVCYCSRECQAEHWPVHKIKCCGE